MEMNLAQDALDFESQVRIHDFGSGLPVGTRKRVRKKFSQQRKKDTLLVIISELEDGSLYLGDVTKGEIQITGLKRVVQNDFFKAVARLLKFSKKSV
jgi:hypothetical protein